MNMSYCRFENTSADLQDCIDAVETMLNNNGKDEHGEELSRSELRSFRDMIQQASYFMDMAESLDELLEDNKTY